MADPFVQEQFDAAIAEGAALSAQVDIGGYTLIGVFVPANWTTAALTFQGSPDDGTTWGEVYDITGVPIEITSLTGGSVGYFVALDPTRFRGLRSLKIRSGTVGAPVVQTAGVTLTLLTRFVY
ncbi:MAG: hypothetical protein WBV35_07230 [Steroidobacteraceae bacterium]